MERREEYDAHLHLTTFRSLALVGPIPPPRPCSLHQSCSKCDIPFLILEMRYGGAVPHSLSLTLRCRCGCGCAYSRRVVIESWNLRKKEKKKALLTAVSAGISLFSILPTVCSPPSPSNPSHPIPPVLCHRHSNSPSHRSLNSNPIPIPSQFQSQPNFHAIAIP